MPKIYLSPSVQEFNFDVNGVSEETMMNYVADALVPYLVLNGFTIKRNSPSMSLARVIADSNAFNPDLHLALHSNAAPPQLSGKVRGPRAYFYTYSEKGRKYATIFINNIKDIYPIPELAKIFPTTQLAELTKTVAPAVLFEIAFHDNVEDSEFISNNVQLIAENIATAICEIFGKTLIPICMLGTYPSRDFRYTMPSYATVCTNVSNLNFRDRPNGNILFSLPKGEQVVATGGLTSNGFLPVRYNSTNGYMTAQYLCICNNPELPFSAKLAVVNTKSTNLNIRSAPNLQSTVLFSLPKGTNLVAFDEIVNNFYRIRYQNTIGYAASEFIKTL